MSDGGFTGADRHRDPVRVERIRRMVDVTVGRGLEVGPLYSPLVTRAEADVRYVDVQLTPELKAHYATHPGIPYEDIVEVDYALIENGRERSLTAAVSPGAPYDWVVASHVVEHVPDVIGWLAELAEVLADGGLLVLAIPDRRYCFDVLRPPTTVGQMLRAHLDGDTRPSARAVFDHFSTAVDMPTVHLWEGAVPTLDDVIHGDAYAWEQVQKSLANGTYVDCHVWLFSPASFVQQLRVLGGLGLLDLTLLDVNLTQEGELEFYVTLRRVPRHLGPVDRRKAVLRGFPTHEDAEDLDDCSRPADRPSSGPLPLSDLEERMVRAKRAVATRARSLTTRLRPRP